MNTSAPSRLLRLAPLALAGAVACSGGDATPDTDDSGTNNTAPYDWFVQPVAGVVVGASSPPWLPPGATGALYTFAGDPTVYEVPVSTGAMPDSSGAQPPAVTGFDRKRVAPMQRLVIAGERIRTDDVAVSAYFEADGAVGVAVPAIAVSASSVEVAAPPLFDSAGNSVAGTARVRIWQASRDGLAVSAPYDGVQIAALPEHPGGSPGLIYAAWLAAAIDDVRQVRADEDLELPAGFRDALGALDVSLTDLLGTVDRAIANPDIPVQLPWTTGDGPLLTPAILTLADRLVIASVAALVDELERQDEPAVVLARRLEQALDDCRRQSHLPELDDQICDLKREGRVAKLGRQLTSWGTRFLMSVYLGVLGGAGSTLAGTQSAEAAIAYEMTFAAGSGHVVSWATGTPPPSHAETQAAATVALVDHLAGTRGMLGAVYSGLTAGQELDQLTRQWRDRIDEPDVPDGGGGAVYEGTLVRVREVRVPSSGCEGLETGTFHVTIGSFAGSGTAADPYTGDVDIFGQIDTHLTGPHPGCPNSTVTIAPTQTQLEPMYEEQVFFSFDGDVGFPIEYWFVGNVESSTTIEGDLSVTVFAPGVFHAVFSGPMELVRQ